jgi:hypothetical protein
MSKREEILDYVAGILANTAGINGRVYRERVEPVREEEIPCVTLDFIRDIPETNFKDFIDWRLQIGVTIITRGGIPSDAADSIGLSVFSIIMNDMTLGGLAMDLTPGDVVPLKSSGDQPIGAIQYSFNIMYRTAAGSLA